MLPLSASRQIWIAAAMLAVVSPALIADDADDARRGVARISVLSGDVSVRRGDSGEWVAAAVNAPVSAEDRIATGAGARAEVQFDSANMLRLAPDSEVRFTELSYRRYLMQVARGTVNFSVLRSSDADVEVDTPTVSVRPRQRGEYRLTVKDDGQTDITVRSGEVEIFTPKGSEKLRAGRTMTVRGTASDPEFQVAAALPLDDWDRWNESRDRALERSAGYRYVSRDVYGVEDLDAHGTWVYVAPYGYCWRPVVAVGWAPYRHGRWVWMDWYGWTWVSYDPWGWAPYHYGRWFWDVGGWCWYPGGMGRHYWSPGLVAFFGYGHGGVGFGFGHMGWVPLGPHEPFHRWWGRDYYGGRGGFHNSVTNVNITNIYRNARVPGGMTAVNSGDFANGRFHNFARVSDGDLRGASLVRGQLPVAPGSANLRYSDAAVRAMPRGGGNERFASRSQAARVERISFSEQRRNFERAGFGNTGAGNFGGGRGSAIADAGRHTPAAGGGPSSTITGAGRGTPAGSGSSGWRRIESPAQVQRGADAGRATAARGGDLAFAQDSRGNSGSSGGWRRFGDPGTGSSATGSSRGVSPGDRSAGRTDSGNRGVTSGPASGGRSEAGNWRRFGDPGSGTASPSVAPRNRESAPSGSGGVRGGGNSNSNSNWQRFSERPSSSLERGTSDNRSSSMRDSRSSGSWSRFGDPGAARGMDRGGSIPSSSRYQGDSRRQESIQMSPRVVRERSPYPSSGGSWRGESRGPSYSAPSGGGVYRNESRGPMYSAPSGSGMRRNESRGSIYSGPSSGGMSRGPSYSAPSGGGMSRGPSYAGPSGGGGSRGSSPARPSGSGHSSNSGGGGRGGRR